MSTAEVPWECLVLRRQRKFSKSPYSRPNDVEVYGLRPMIHPWKLLSPFEFSMKWKAEPVLPPHHYSRSGLEQRSVWADNVEAAVRSQQKLAIPGVHYFVAERPDAEPSRTYFTWNQRKHTHSSAMLGCWSASHALKCQYSRALECHAPLGTQHTMQNIAAPPSGHGVSWVAQPKYRIWGYLVAHRKRCNTFTQLA